MDEEYEGAWPIVGTGSLTVLPSSETESKEERPIGFRAPKEKPDRHGRARKIGFEPPSQRREAR